MNFTQDDQFSDEMRRGAYPPEVAGAMMARKQMPKMMNPDPAADATGAPPAVDAATDQVPDAAMDAAPGGSMPYLPPGLAKMPMMPGNKANVFSALLRKAPPKPQNLAHKALRALFGRG